MQDGFHFYRPGEGHGLSHDPFNAIIAPRPIGWISSHDKSGIANLAPYSFFNAFNYTPPIIGFSSIGYKDSVRNIEETGEFCWNLASKTLAEAMNQSCASVAANIDEFELAGLEKQPSEMIAVPHVKECGVVMECKKTQIIQLTGADQKRCDTYLVLGEVVGVHIRDTLIEDGVYQTTKGDPILRGGGPGDYFGISEAAKFVMRRP